MTVSKEQAREQARNQQFSQPQPTEVPKVEQPPSTPNGLKALVDMVAPQLQPKFNDLMNTTLLMGWVQGTHELAQKQMPSSTQEGEFTKVFIQTQIQTGSYSINQTVIAGSTSTASLPSASNGNSKN